jgi:sugar (pentulose or hexulose) kinase
VLGIPVVRVPGDAASSGVAMLAGLGVGVYQSVADAVATACRTDAAIEPDGAAHARYDEVYERYRALAASALVHRGGTG